jgi:hypothetical protein
VMKIKIAVFWVLTPCIVVVGHQRFGGPCFFHLQSEERGGKKVPRDVKPRHYTASQPRNPQLHLVYTRFKPRSSRL